MSKKTNKQELDKKVLQILITGKPIEKPQAEQIRNYLSENNLFAVDWIHPDGTIGYIDNSLLETNPKSLREELEKLTKVYPFLDAGISLLSGKCGEQNTVLVSFRLKDGKVRESTNPHVGHSHPKRWKP